MIRDLALRICTMCIAVALCATTAFASSSYDYDGGQLGLYFGSVQWHVGFDESRGNDVPQTCIAVMSAGAAYYYIKKDMDTFNSYQRAAISLAQAYHYNQTAKPDWVDADIYEAGRLYGYAVYNEDEFEDEEPGTGTFYQLKLKDLLRNVVKCERLYPDHSRATTAAGTDNSTSSATPPPAPTRAVDSTEGLCAIAYDAYVRTLIEQSFADKSVTIDIRADRDAVWRQIRNRSKDTFNLGSGNRNDLPANFVDISKSITNEALKNPAKFAVLKSEIDNCDSQLKLPAIPLGY